MKTKCIMIVCFFLAISVCSAEEIYKIGVLAKNGPVKAMKMWKSTGDFLSSNLKGKKFEIVPLDFDDVFPAIEQKKKFLW